MSETPTYKKKDFVSDQDVKWCPGCGDYAILSSVQQAMTKIGKKKEDIAFISGIGCSSRFPYYMDTYGLHGIHGRAPALASGLKTHNPDLSVWVITGDGDGLSIGGNHTIHMIRRNIDLNVILFNNEIYGLTKGQYSPTSKPGIKTKSTPFGSIDHPFKPGKLILGSGSTFYARSLDTDPKHMTEVMTEAATHKGTSYIEVFQNCVIFNNAVHDAYTNRQTREDNLVRLEHGKPMIYGKNKDKGLMLKGTQVVCVTIGENGVTESDLLVHDVTDENLSNLLANLEYPNYPVPVGVFYKVDLPAYDQQVQNQVDAVTEKKGKGTTKDILYGGSTWEIK